MDLQDLGPTESTSPWLSGARPHRELLDGIQQGSAALELADDRDSGVSKCGSLGGQDDALGHGRVGAGDTAALEITTTGGRGRRSHGDIAYCGRGFTGFGVGCSDPLRVGTGRVCSWLVRGRRGGTQPVGLGVE